MFFKKSLGQNLLIDKNIIKKILSSTDIRNKNVVEIGPGTGNLTKEIIKLKPKKLLLIEKDKNLYSKLQKSFASDKSIQTINLDILKFNLKDLEFDRFTVFGNLPYNISSQILVKFINFYDDTSNYKKIIFMFQKEVGQKIIANFKTKNYSRLSILTKSRLKILNYFYVSKNCFFPKPKVDSIIIEFEPIKKKEIKVKNIKSLEFVTRVIFSNKRKMINKSLKKLFKNIDAVAVELKINLKLRPQELDELTYYKIANRYDKISNIWHFIFFVISYYLLNLAKTFFEIIINNNIIIIFPV